MVAAVSSMLQILKSKRGVTPETMKKGLASIEANIARVLEITQRLGQFSRVGAEAPAPLAIDDAVDSAIALLRHSAWGAAIEVEHKRARGATVASRPGELQQVVFNLLLNAAQAMGGKGRIRITIDRDDDRAAVAVRDSGPGIPPDIRAQVFEPFFTTKARGGGLGLPIAKRTAEMHGGSLTLTCPPEGGTVVVLLVPIAAKGQPDTTAPSDPGAASRA